jgi:ethanolamine utilization protein EutA
MRGVQCRRRIGPPYWHEFEFEHEHESDGPDGSADGTRIENDFYLADNIELTTVGIDVGSSTSHLMFSRLHLQRQGKYLSSRYVVIERHMLYQSPILLTPYRADYTIEAGALNEFFEGVYADAGLTAAEVDSGAIILTGEAIKRTNARAVADLFAEHAGKFVCASAGHNLEAVLAANGSGALALSRQPARTVLNVDVGGGTSKLALLRGGHVLETAATNVGGRLVALDDDERVVRIEPAARLVAEHLGLDLRLGRRLNRQAQSRMAEVLGACLFEVVRRAPLSHLAQALMLTPPLSLRVPVDQVTFSGGVSEYLFEPETPSFGDLARPLAASIATRVAEHGLPVAPQATGTCIRATVMGASQFTVQVSGNTIDVSRPDLLPLHNIQVLYPSVPGDGMVDRAVLSGEIGRSFERFDLVEGEQVVAIAINWSGVPHYAQLREIAAGIVEALPRTVARGLPIVVVFTQDFGKLVGGIMRDELLPGDRANDVISLDGIELQELDYIDIGTMIFPAQVVPVVVKSLVFPQVLGPRAEMEEAPAAHFAREKSHGG